MININDNFDDIIGKIIDISPVPEFIEIQINQDPNEFYVCDIYLDDHDESDSYSFNWIITKPFRLQSEETKRVLNFLLCQ